MKNVVKRDKLNVSAHSQQEKSIWKQVIGTLAFENLINSSIGDISNAIVAAEWKKTSTNKIYEPKLTTDKSEWIYWIRPVVL